LRRKIRAILDLLERDKLIPKIEDLIKHLSRNKGEGEVVLFPVQFNSNYDDIFRSAG